MFTALRLIWLLCKTLLLHLLLYSVFFLLLLLVGAATVTAFAVFWCFVCCFRSHLCCCLSVVVVFLRFLVLPRRTFSTSCEFKQSFLHSKKGSTDKEIIPKNLKDGSSSRRCSMTSHGDLKKINRNANEALNWFRFMQIDSHREDGHSSNLDQKRSGILLMKANHKENGTESQS